MWAARRTFLMVLGAAVCLTFVPTASADANDIVCASVLGKAAARGPTNAVAWRVGIEPRTPVFYRLPGKRLRPSRWLGQTDARWLLVVGRPRAADSGCWLRVRLPWRP